VADRTGANLSAICESFRKSLATLGQTFPMQKPTGVGERSGRIDSMVAPSAPRDARSKIPPGPEGSNGIDRRGCRGQTAGSSPFWLSSAPKALSCEAGEGWVRASSARRTFEAICDSARPHPALRATFSRKRKKNQPSGCSHPASPSAYRSCFQIGTRDLVSSMM
jgi:hypothetical protein